ncbi:phosphonate ABC transporter, permease protein PhnE [Oceanibaculum nanhaiense]|uniref:phosphonate ABC transporter, permease protein PhnE n=1 Tax=Oceanibaculum nanhaiense TaxID=1909734 RepID=UPI00396E7BC7
MSSSSSDAPPRIELAAFETLAARHRAMRLRRTSLGAIAFLAALSFAVHVSGFDPTVIIAGLPRVHEFFGGMVPPMKLSTLGADLASWFWGIQKWLGLLWTTVMMALFGTVMGTLVGGLLSFYATPNLGASGITIFIVRRALEIARTVPDLVWALIFMFAFGLGPLAGVLALFVHSLGAQGKLFAEANENTDPKPLEGVRASGGTWLDEIAIGVLPQVLPNFVSYALWRFEINVRTATVIGFVGAGGIGMELYEAISLNYFDDAGAILLMVFFAVMAIDMLSEWARLRLAGLLQ